MTPQQLTMDDFTYVLPEDRIAKYPLPQRDASKLLIYQQGALRESLYRHIDEYLPENSLLVFNNTRVIAARILFQKVTGALIEIFCLEPGDAYADISTAMTQQGRVVWKCLIGGASKWKPGQVLQKTIATNIHSYLLNATYLRKEQDYFLIELNWTPAGLTFAELLHEAGLMPLPPYIKRAAESSDATRYQTIYAANEGSVAAPTAGLHFTPAVFEKLAARHIEKSFVTLHVGAGTFKPVKTATIGEHTMHAEFIDVPATSIRKILDSLHRPVTVVGTTSLRTTESLYWLGVKTVLNPSLAPEDLTLHQWDAYELPAGNISVAVALEALLQWLEAHQLERLITKTRLLIAPGYQIKIAQALVTNFHQPQSTLLLLVAAFIGADWKRVYQYALENDFRFLSYGDGCLMFRQ